MKSFIGFLSRLVAVFLLVYFLGPNLLCRLTRDLVPFPTRCDQVKVEIARKPDVPENMTITNRSKIKVKVYAYNSDDWVRGIPRKGSGWILNSGESATYSLDNYRFKVVVPGIFPFERLLAQSGIVGSEVEITGDNKNSIKISGKPKRKVTFTNKASENIRIIVYNPEDRVHLSGLMDWYLVAGQKIEWDDAPPMFTMKVFRPQLLDKVLAAASNIRDQSDIVIRSRGIWGWIKDLFS
jgi:hypothetical protein